MNNLNLIIGEDQEQISFYVSEMLKKINYNPDNLIEYDLSSFHITDILDEASMISLFADTKVIIGNDFDIVDVDDNDYDYLVRYLTSINDKAYIILVASKVDARLKAFKIFKENFNIVDTAKLNSQEALFNYVLKKIKDNNYQMDRYSVEYLINKTGSDINNINSELDKLFIFKENEKIITRDDIDLLVIDNIDNVIYEFTNAVLERDQDQIVKMYNNFQIENVGPDYLLVSLSNMFRQVLIIKLLDSEGKSNLEISKVIGKKEFYVKKMLERLYDYSIKDICKYINKLSCIDKNFKLGSTNYDELVFFLIDMNR